MALGENTGQCPRPGVEGGDSPCLARNVLFHHFHVVFQIFTNKCLKPGCKQKEMMKVICDQCHQNYCLKHRHPLDHNCSGVGRPLSKAG